MTAHVVASRLRRAMLDPVVQSLQMTRDGKLLPMCSCQYFIRDTTAADVLV